MKPAEADITTLLGKLARGDQGAEAELIPLVYEELHRLAARYMRREKQGHTLQTTALVNEAYLRLVRQQCANWQNKASFLGLAAKLMRRILVDHARLRRQIKRGGGYQKLALDEALYVSETRSHDLLALDDALSTLAKLDPRQSEIVEMRFFGGLTEDEIAATLKISPRTVRRDWNIAKAWLYMQLVQDNGSHSGKVEAGQSSI